jgi:hypothetical protein
MTETVYSPAVAAALAANPKLRAAVQAGAAMPTTALQPAVVAVVATSTRETMERAGGLSRAALQEAQSLVGSDEDAIVVTLGAIDEMDERTRRYRLATGRALNMATKGIPVAFKAERSMLDEVDTLARQRGEARGTTIRWLVACGILLACERRWRYETTMLQANEALRAKGQIVYPPSPSRYVDPDSPSLERAAAMAAKAVLY